MDAGSIWIKLGLDATSLNAGLASAKVSLVKWRDETNASTKSMAKWGAAIGATIAPILAVSTAAYAATMKFGAMAQELEDLSYTTGLTTQKIQQLQYAATLSGTEFSMVSGALNKLSLSIADAGDETTAASKAFKEIGVTTDGRTIDEVFDDTALALVSMKNTTERNRIAMDLYGKSWKDLLPYMQTYTEKAEEIKKHPVYSDEERQALIDAKIEWEKLGDSVTIYTGKAIAATEKTQNLLRNLNPIYLALFGGNDGGSALAANGSLTAGADFANAAITAGSTATEPLSVDGNFYQTTLDQIAQAVTDSEAGKDMSDLFEGIAKRMGEMYAAGKLTYEEFENLRKVLGEAMVTVDGLTSSVISMNSTIFAVSGAYNTGRGTEERIYDANGVLTSLNGEAVNQNLQTSAVTQSYKTSMENQLVAQTGIARITEILSSVANPYALADRINAALSDTTGAHSVSSSTLASWQAEYEAALKVYQTYYPQLTAYRTMLANANEELAYYGLAEGGIALSPTLRVFGEAGPEAVVPLDRIGEVAAAMGSRAGGNTITLNQTITGNASPEKVARATTKAVSRALAEQIVRGGGT